MNNEGAGHERRTSINWRYGIFLWCMYPRQIGFLGIRLQIVILSVCITWIILIPNIALFNIRAFLAHINQHH